jgi:seryl-tRNA synthetase
MVELQLFRTAKAQLIESLRKRNVEQGEEIVEEVIALDDQRKQLQTQLDDLRADSNRISKKIGQLYQEGKGDEAEQLKNEVSQSKDRIKALEEEYKSAKSQLEEKLFNIPNILHEKVQKGKDESDNELFRDYEGDLPELPESAKPHWELAQEYGILDMEMGAKLSGSGFPVFLDKGARLQRALVAFFLERARIEGYREVSPPLLVNEATARGTGQLPDKEGQMYRIEKDDLYLIPTAEVPLTNIYRDVILEEDDFPLKITGYTPCFRREAGSYGADVKGLNRVHQFDKVEIVQVQHPDKSYDTLHEMMNHVAGVLEDLDLPYRIMRLCGGDTGFAAAMTYDFEVYSAAQKKWLEVSSVSNFETFQSNRMMLRYRTGKGTELAHTLNGSALALARIIASILENGQTEEGIRIPDALVPYTGFELIEAPGS